ncbi:PucR family transcriptional regulator [Leucobacter allii]|uniref:PucR family transcriptional regulator n=1 Tax=Leucobacter allii TaxID=2932247 RepID=UPI001FD0D802|nr:PucR family transcriptional regulator [Leucobacter allii]UOR02149.1 PucR family transcriptional regulator [Leucobacter allii]
MFSAPDPAPLEAAHAVSVADALALPELAAGSPEVVAGADGLQRQLRWAHVVAGTSAIPLLEGGELVLTTGAGWPTDPEGLRRLARELVAAEPAAVILELHTAYAEPPAPLVRACEAAGIPLVALRREVRFVQVTQRIHQRMLALQTEALAARAEVHTMLTELGLNRSPVDYVVERLSETLDAPVVLEDSAERVVAWSGRGHDPESVLAPWSRATDPDGGAGRGAADDGAGDGTTRTEAHGSRVASAAARSAEAVLPTGSERVPVEAQGERWGRLSALPGPPHPAGRRTVLELGAFALALGKLADDREWLQLSSKRLFDVLLSGRYRRDAELATQLAAAGLPLEGRVLLGATLRGIGDFGAHDSLEHAILETALRRAVAPEGRAIIVTDPGAGARDGSRAAPPGEAETRAPLLALLSFPQDDPRVAPAQAAATPPLAARLARELDMLLPSTTPKAWRAHLALGAAGTGLRSLIASMERVRAAGRLRAVAGAGRVTVQQAERQALAYLVRGIAADPEVQEFAAETLGPLIAHDAASGPGHSGDLLRVLGAYLEHPANRSLAAQRARLSRSVFYQRLALIEDLLGVDLSDGTTIATLSVALLARG